MKDEITVKVQNMFPNCKKYTKCCSDDSEFWDNVTKVTKRRGIKTHPRTKRIKLEPKNPPKDFENIVISRLDN